MDGRTIVLFNSVFLTKKFIDKDIWTKLKNSTDFSEIPAAEVENLEDGKMVIEENEDEKRLNELRAGRATRPSVEVMYLFLTNTCNLKCKYCVIDKEHAQKETGSFMTRETADRAIELFFMNTETKEPGILLWGGEPLSNWDVFKRAVGRARELEKKYSKKLVIYTVSNGTLLTQEIAEFFKANHVGCSISMDGLKEQHDSMRIYADGRGTYGDIRNNLKLLKEAGVEFGISLAIGSHNVDVLPAVGRELCKDLEAKRMGSSLLVNVDSANPAYTANERVAGQLINLFKELSAAGILEDPVTRKVKSFAFNKEHLHSCGAGGLQIAVMPNGYIGICHYAASAGKWLIGTVNDTAEKVFRSQALAEWARRSPINMPQCYECPGLVMCGGGCPYDAYQKKGDLWGLDERFCTLCNESIKWMMQELYKARRPARAAKSAVLVKMEEVVAQTNFIRTYLHASPEVVGVAVTEEELQRGADSFRLSNGLTSAKATEEWMSHHGITPEFFAEFLECAILIGTYRDRQKNEAASLEQMENLGR
jgi:uncharacterized protein